jgi:hypothetical protein
MAEINWAVLQKSSGFELRGLTFRAISEISNDIQDYNVDDPHVLSAVPRLADLLDDMPELEDFRPILSTLARSIGLWNYIDTEAGEARDRLLAQAASVNLGRRVVLHKEQIAALNILLAGKNLILSAPTSFGKSLLIDVLLTTGRYNRVAIILPTIALLDEFRKRLISRFGQKYQIIMHHSEPRGDGDKVIYLGTQERLLNRSDIGKLDILVVDEFYKLDPNRNDDRSITLNAAVYSLLRKSSQFFFLGPNIERVSGSHRADWSFEFFKTRFSTVAVDVVDLKKASGGKFASLKGQLFNPVNWPALVFVSGPDAAVTLSKKLVELSIVDRDANMALADWLSQNYGSQWTLIAALRAGIGLHHGRIPRAVASFIVRRFNSPNRKLPIVLCTSTLIEGVNTAAKSVFIYDKNINGSSYDFFTFSNIAGRAGRLGEHRVGKVFLFNAEPEKGFPAVSPTVFVDPDDVKNEMVFHFEGDDRTPSSQERVADFVRVLGIAYEDIKRLSPLGMDKLKLIKAAVDEEVNAGRAPLLVWRARPEYENISALIRCLCKFSPARECGAGSEDQLTRYILKLRAASSMRYFFNEYSMGLQPQYEKYFEGIFKFLRACEYSLPEYISAIEVFVKRSRVKGAESVDYSLLTEGLGRWFRPESLKILEEQGVPIQISERFYTPNLSLSEFAQHLRSRAKGGDAALSDLEAEWILTALPDPSDTPAGDLSLVSA